MLFWDDILGWYFGMIFFDDSTSWFENSKGLTRFWRLAKDLDLPKFWPLGVSRDQKFKMKNSEHRFSSKNNVSKYGPETEKHHSENELKIIHYVQTWPPDVKNLKKSSQQFLLSTSKFDRLKTWVADCSAQGRNLTKSF